MTAQEEVKKLEKANDEAWQAYEIAHKAYDDAWQTYVIIADEIYYEAQEAYRIAHKAYLDALNKKG